MIKLAVFDVDGTLIPEGSREPSTTTIEMLKQLKANGIKIAIASGRPPFFVKGDLDRYIEFDYYICVNGGYVADSTFKELDRKAISLNDVELLVNDFMHYDDAIMFQFDDGAYCYHGNKRVRHMINKWIGRLDVLSDNRQQQDRHLQNLPLGAVCQIADEHIEFYKQKHPGLLFESFGEDYYDIHEKNYSKKDGIDVIINTLNISMDEVIAFGDNYNDVEMINAVGIGVAMGNAKEDVKKVSDYICDTVNQDGVYQACKHFGLI